ncbi:hypothetical protein BG60_09345 [Caballeronia zhejiangensis]|uniref:Uncharacterized protein n=1 Tax=Caballeronia zhejiangensis TaxID=871203 RepID=A0A656QHU9_9BURK|nr:hypothetical protein BG58_28390 [Caballeronia jiangsuensis]KDR28900.1 hypothetical protein BG60_09345 [Caballeronia zhejiangensis]
MSCHPENSEVASNSDVVLAVADLIAAPTAKLGMSEENTDLALRLMQWSFFGFEKDMPCTPIKA